MNAQKADNMYRFIMNSLGIAMIFFFMGLVLLLLYSFFYDICKLHFFVTRSYTFTVILLLTGVFIGFNTCFNYMMVVLTPPGGTENLKDPVFPQELGKVSLHINQDDSDEDDLEDAQSNIRMKKCPKCIRFKPLRSHHCSICDKCVLRMDHHCPWINNCVGHFNQRYFLLMIFYVLIGTGIFVITGTPLMLGDSYRAYIHERTGFFKIVYFVALCLFVMMVPFNMWNWYLASTGQTTIEFFSRRAIEAKERENVGAVDFRQNTSLKNLEYVFGKTSLLKMFMPSVRSSGHEGVNWESYRRRAI